MSKLPLVPAIPVDPTNKTHRKYRAIFDACHATGLDWTDPTNREALADLAFEQETKRHGPPPSAMDHKDAREGWLRYADRLREVLLPLMSDYVAEQETTP